MPVHRSGGCDSTFANNLGDAFEWDGSTWTQLPANGPASRHGATMVYDARRAAVILFGGRHSGGFFADTWSIGASTGSGGIQFDGGRIAFPQHGAEHGRRRNDVERQAQQLDEPDGEHGRRRIPEFGRALDGHG